MKHEQNKKTHLLMILDGWGYREDSEDNAIALANTPHWDNLWETYPHTLLEASGNHVGLPNGQMGNSEVGHINIGSGRIVYQDLTRIDLAIQNKTLSENPVLQDLFKRTSTHHTNLHIMGLLSEGGVHSHESQIFSMIRLAHQSGVQNIYFHAFLDGRDTPPQSAQHSLEKLVALFKSLKCGAIASISGRYYAMDRDNRWDRIESAYLVITEPQNLKNKFHATSAIEGLHAAYERGETDEFVQPTVISNISKSSTQPLKSSDEILFMNFRADRARQLSQKLTESSNPNHCRLTTLTEYSTNLKADVLFAPEKLKNILGQIISEQGMTQLRIAETEKYAHVTFFFNGGQETPFPQEDRILVPSPNVATYDLKPEMSAYEMTNKLIHAIESEKYDLIVCNFANADMVGHTGKLDAAIKAIEVLDECMGNIVTTLRKHQSIALITADHGNADLMRNANTQIAHTAHTNNPVPLLYITPDTVDAKTIKAQPSGQLSDIAPTLLDIMNLPIPKEMTGHPLFNDKKSTKDKR